MKKITHGFTLMEALITLLIVAILAAIAAPSMQEFVKNERLTGQVNVLISHFMLARSEALKRNQSVVLCPSSNQVSCTASSGEEGWIIFVDTDDNGVVSGADEIIKIQQALEGDDVELTGLVTVTYDHRGFTPNSSGTFTLCDDRGVAEAKVLNLSNTGRVRRSGVASC